MLCYFIVIVEEECIRDDQDDQDNLNMIRIVIKLSISDKMIIMNIRLIQKTIWKVIILKQ